MRSTKIHHAKHTNLMRILSLLFLAFLSLSNVLGQTKSEAITIGLKHQINSVILHENREYWVYLPADYEQSKYHYPVLYLLDGQEHFHQVTGLVNHLSRLVQRMPRTIVVGIVSSSKDRVRDYTPNPIEVLPNGGGADQFTRFLKTELIPQIENNYRTNDCRLLFGHSLAGVYVNYVYTRYNTLFDSYFAADPAIFVDSTIAQNLKVFITSHNTIRSHYYLTVSGLVDSTTIVPNVELNTFIQSNYADKLNWNYQFYPHEDHVSMTLKAIYDGLEKRYSDYKIPIDYLYTYNLEGIQQHIVNNENNYNCTVALPEQLINEYAMHFCFKNKYKEALQLLQLNLKHYINPYETYYFMGEVHRLQGNTNKALHYYEKSLAIDEFEDVKAKIMKLKN